MSVRYQSNELVNVNQMKIWLPEIGFFTVDSGIFDKLARYLDNESGLPYIIK